MLTLFFEPVRARVANQACENPTETAGWSSYSNIVRRLTSAILVVSAWTRVTAQAPDRTLERIHLALERPPSVWRGADREEALRTIDRTILGVPVYEPLADTPKLGPFEFVAPQFRGEFIRLAVPIGEYLSHGTRTLAAAKRHRQEQAAHRAIEAVLKPRIEHHHDCSF